MNHQPLIVVLAATAAASFALIFAAVQLLL